MVICSDNETRPKQIDGQVPLWLGMLWALLKTFSWLFYVRFYVFHWLNFLKFVDSESAFESVVSIVDASAVILFLSSEEVLKLTTGCLCVRILRWIPERLKLKLQSASPKLVVQEKWSYRLFVTDVPHLAKVLVHEFGLQVRLDG